MLGYNMAFASFHVVEVMCSPDFASKRIGYLAAAQSFSPTTDVLLLTTNQFKKDLTNGRMQDCSQALTCLAKLVTESLVCDLSTDVSMLLSSPRPYIRKKTLLVLYRFITVYPETLAVISDKFRACLHDPDPGVVCAAVTVTCELARASPADFLGLAPALYALLTSSTNNWMLIKIVKLMGTLTPLEPRLGKKLVGPLMNLMRTTRAKSLLYECCATVTLGLLEFPEAAELCGKRLGEFMVDADQNLKYLGLLSMGRLAVEYPDIAMQHRDLVLDCMDDVDIGIRMRALDLVSEFVTRRTLRDIARILLRKLHSSNQDSPAAMASPPEVEGADSSTQAASSYEASAEAASATSGLLLDPETPYRDALAAQLLVPGTYVRGEGYPLLSSGDDFAWYAATVLGGLARSQGLSKVIWETVALQLIELIARVEAVRPATVAVASALLSASSSCIGRKRPRGAAVDCADAVGFPQSGVEPIDLASGPGPSEASEDAAQLEEAVVESVRSREIASHPLSPPVLASAAWVIGENADLLKDRVNVLEMLLSYPLSASSCPAQVAILGAAVKVYASCASEEAEEWHDALLARLREGVTSELAEVHERALLLHKLVELAGTKSLQDIRDLFDEELLPVDSRAQAKVPVPAGLDLDRPLLDTGGVDLYTYLTSNTEDSVMDDSCVDGGGDGDEDDLFHQLEKAGDLGFGGARAPPRQNVPSVSGDSQAANPFYLRGGSETDPGDSNSSSLPGNSNGQEKNDAGGGFGTSTETNFEHGRAPVAVLVDEADKKPRKGKSRKPAVVEGDGRYGTAFQGLFSGPTAVAGTGPAQSAGSGEQKKRRKSSKRKKKASSDAKDTSANSNLIDFDGPSVVDASKSKSEEEGAGTKPPPAHATQTDLLL